MNAKSASKGNLMILKSKLVLAELGFSLLEKKKNILLSEFMMLIQRVKEINKKIDAAYSNAYQYLKKANVSLGICKEISVSVPEETSLEVSIRNVMGIDIPVFSINSIMDSNPPFGLYNSNDYLDKTYKEFQKVKILTVEYAELEISIYRLINAIKKIKKKVNSLENIVIPSLKPEIKKMSENLEEKEREEFIRLKMIKKTF